MDDLRHVMDEQPDDELGAAEGDAVTAEPHSRDEWSAAISERVSSYSPSASEPVQAAVEPLTHELPEPSAGGTAEATSHLDSESGPVVQSEPERSRRLAHRRSKGETSTTSRRDARKAEKRHKPKKLVGLKVGASQIAAARVVNNGVAELVQAVREPLAPGVVVAGEIRDAEALAEALKGFFARNKLPKSGVRLGLSNNRIGVRLFDIEAVEDERQLENAIRFRAEEVLPIPLDEAVLDYVVLGEDTREDGTLVQRILLVVAYRDSVERYVAACRLAGLDVVGVDLEAFALLRSLAAPTDDLPAGSALIAVAVGYDRTTIAVSTGRVCEFTRMLDWGGLSLNVAIARELDRAPSEVETIKRQLSFADDTVLPDGLTDVQAAKVREAVRRALATFARELVASLQFYQAQPGALAIGEVVLTGGTAHMPGLPDELERLIGVPVRLGDPLARVAVDPSVEYDGPSGSLAVAIGLGIED